MEYNKRKEYFIFTFIFWGIGFLLFGGMGAVNRELLNIPWNVFLVFMIYGLAGGLLLGGLASGIILFTHFWKRQKLGMKVILCIFFFITFMLICIIGILSFLPYEIYNVIMMKKQKQLKL